MNYRAAEIYFGQQWTTGTFKFPPAYKFDVPSIVEALTLLMQVRLSFGC